MQTRIQALILALALSGAGAPVLAQDDAATPAAAAPEAPAAEAPAAEAQPTEAPAATAAAPADDADKGKVSVDIDIDTDEDDGADVVGRALGTGLAAILEEHVLTHDELSEEDREEVREAIAELRGEIQTETKAATREAVKEIGKAGKEIDREIKDAVKEKRRVVMHSSDDDGFGFLQAIVAIVAIVFTLGMPIIIVSLIMYSSYRRRRLAHETITQYVSSGKEIPPEIMQNLFKDAGAAQTPRTNLHKGSVNTGIGLGMVVGFSIIDVEFLAAIGFIFLLVGLAQLLIWKLEQGKKNGGDATQG